MLTGWPSTHMCPEQSSPVAKYHRRTRVKASVPICRRSSELKRMSLPSAAKRAGRRPGGISFVTSGKTPVSAACQHRCEKDVGKRNVFAVAAASGWA